ncbi:MAG: hypothetical protein HY953_00260, partial [Candidatus Rokubacteria bacterium]|nr:hypothetical protein [Candidatus Rokubacteria bacterium]
MSRSLPSRIHLVLVAMFASTCSEQRGHSTLDLDAVLAAPALGLGVARGKPSQLQLEAGQYLYGKATATHLELGVRSSAVSVNDGSGPGLKLRPLEGPQAFASWGPGVASGSAVIYASPDGRSAVVEQAGPTGLKEDVVLGRSLGDALRFSWELELGEGLEARLDADGSVGVYGMSSLLNSDIQAGDEKSR